MEPVVELVVEPVVARNVHSIKCGARFMFVVLYLFWVSLECISHTPSHLQVEEG